MVTIKLYLTAILIFFTVFENISKSAIEKPVYKIVFTKNLFSNVNINDASAALKVWVAELSKSVNSKFKLEALLVDDIAELEKLISKDKIALICSNVTDFLKYREKLKLEGAFIQASSGNVFNKYLLITKKSNPDIKTLKGKTLGIQPSGHNMLPNIWLDLLLFEKKQQNRKLFFRQINDNDIESQLIMSVFFSQYDACIATKGAFNLMCELNPQIGKELHPVAESPEMIFTVTSFPNNFANASHRKLIVDVAKKINTYPGGKQIMTLMNTSEIALFNESYLENIKQMLKTYDRISGK